MKTFKKALAIMMCVVITLTTAPLGGFVGLDLSGLFDFKAEAATYSGTCGDNLTWSLDTETGVLEISGTGAMYNWSYPSYAPWYSYRKYIESINIGNSVTTIGNYAFRGCESLTSVTIPDSVTTIGEDTFSYCSGLTSVTIPDSVTTIGDSAFYWCDSLTSITIPDSVTSIGDYAFAYCSGLTSITIPDSVTTIGDSAFYWCDSLTSITIPDSVTTIGYAPFASCDSLTSITVDEDNKYFFSNSYGVLFNKDKNTLIQYPVGNTRTSYTIPDSVTTIGYGAFYDCTSLTSVTIPDSVTTIGDSAFYNCYNLTSVTIPDSVTTIGDGAFSSCNSLTSITIPDSVTAIGDKAFYWCDSLTSVTIPDSVTTIGDSAFYNCDSLTSVTIGNSVTTIGEDAFSSCESLTSVTIGKSVTTIGGSAFTCCDSLTSVTIPDSVTTIGNNAFRFCNSLTSVTIPDSVTTIDSFTFEACTSLTSVTIGKGVTTIGEDAFYYCTSLTSVTIPNSVKSIGENAFGYCHSLTDVYYLGTEEQWSEVYIEAHNESLLNATIHFNSTGPDDNTSGEEPSDEEKYKNATITLDKDSYTVKEPDLLKISGTISCPDGVDGLLMSWSFDDTDAFYTASQTTYETVSETEKHFSVNFSPKKAGKFKIYAVLSNGAKAECTVESYKSCAPAYITEHLQFIESNEYNNFLNSKTAENLADSMRSNPSYHWNNAVSMNFFENYYDIVLAELLTGATTQKTMLETFYGAWSKECTGLLKEVFDFLDSSGKVNFENVTFEEFLDVFNTNNPDAYKNTTIYKMVVDAVGNDHTKMVNAVFKTSDIIGVAGDIFSASLDVYDGIRECVYYFSAINAYRYTSEYFKDVIQKASELTDNSDLKESLDTYASIDSESDYIDFAKSLYERAENSTIQTAVKIYFDLFGIGRTAKFVTNIMLKGGTKLASKVVTVSTKAGTFTATVAQYANAAISGVTLGMAVSEIITNSNDYCDYASKCTHAGDFAEVFANVLKEFENNFTKSQTIEDALRFDAAFNLYKDTQVYALKSKVDSVNAQENSLVAKPLKLLNLKYNIAPFISKINRYNNLHCHEHELDELITGEYYFIDEKYSGNKVIRVACPVDVYVYDSAGNLAASIENDFVKIFDDRLNAYVLNSEKYICIPLDEEFTIKIVSTDDGEMDYSVFEFDENSEMTREVSKENISLETNKTFDGKINNILNTDADNYNLTVSDTQEKIAMENDINCIPATDIEVSESTISLKTGQSKTLYATVSPSNTTDKFAWISSDETVATVSENGTVKAVNAGKATIIAMVNDILYANCEITVDELKNYTVNWIVDGVTTQQTVKEGDAIIKPADPEKTCFRFIGWTPYVPSTMPANNLTFTAQFELATQLEIKTPSTTTINYGDTLVLHADLGETALPEGYSILWTIEGTGVNITPGEDGLTCEVTSVQKGDVTVKATVVDENGEAVMDANGNEMSDSKQLTSKAGFWQKLVSFFKNLFGISRVILQSM